MELFWGPQELFLLFFFQLLFCKGGGQILQKLAFLTQLNIYLEALFGCRLGK